LAFASLFLPGLGIVAGQGRSGQREFDAGFAAVLSTTRLIGFAMLALYHPRFSALPNEIAHLPRQVSYFVRKRGETRMVESKHGEPNQTSCRQHGGKTGVELPLTAPPLTCHNAQPRQEQRGKRE